MVRPHALKLGLFSTGCHDAIVDTIAGSEHLSFGYEQEDGCGGKQDPMEGTVYHQ